MANEFKKDPNDIGCIWTKENERGTTWLSIKLDLDQLLVCTGGATGEVNLVAFGFTRKKTSERQPDYQVLYPKKGASRETGERLTAAKAPPLLDDDIPF